MGIAGKNDKYFVKKLSELNSSIRNRVWKSLLRQSRGLGEVAGQASGDVSYKIDLPAEKVLEEFCSEWAKEIPLVLVSEHCGRKTFPKGIQENKCKFILIVDPIDGTRPLKERLDSAWVLSAIAPNKGLKTSLEDLRIAAQTEIPLPKKLLKTNESHELYGIKGKRAWVVLRDMRSGRAMRIVPKKHSFTTISQHVAYFVSPYRGGKDIIGGVAEKTFSRILGPQTRGTADPHTHGYDSSAGQMFCLFDGKYRFVGDIRPWVEPKLIRRGEASGLTAHSYDLCTKLILEQLGVVITDLHGRKLNAPLDTKTNVGWLGYVNPKIRKQVEPVVLDVLKNYDKIKAREFLTRHPKIAKLREVQRRRKLKELERKGKIRILRKGIRIK